MIITGKKFSKPAMSRVINGDTILAPEQEKSAKIRLDHLLMEQHPEFNRSSLQKFIKAGYVLVNGTPATKPNTALTGEEEITLNLPPEPVTKTFHPETIYEDAHVIVLNKPAGLLSMVKGEYCPEPTLEDYGLLVHRLDRDTSGVVILAKDPETQSMLRRQFQERTTHKTYYAVVTGRPKLDEALIDLPIARNLKHPTTFQVEAGGKPSQTAYKVFKTTDTLSLLELKPATGRTHQLRVHLKYIGTPILGDPVYGDPKKSKSLKADRLYLHAHSLEISIPDPADPAHKLRQTFTAPLPKEFEDVLR